MPYAALRACRCGALVGRLGCPRCAQAHEQRRGTAHARGYDRHWLRFRPQFLALLVQAGLNPVCGEALPNGPTIRDSACRDAGLWTFTSADGSSLHLDHEPELEDWERSLPERVCDATRIVLKCASCHAMKTAREMAHHG
jgi:hypothetical protein